MGDEFNNAGSGNWWGASSRNRFDQSGGGGGQAPSSSSSSCSSSGLSCGTLGGFGWVATESETVEIKDRSTNSIDSGGSVVFQDKLQNSSAADHHHHLQMMGLGLSSQPVDQWSQSLLRGTDKAAETSFRVMLGENINQQQQEQPSTLSTQMFWRDRSNFFLDHPQSQFSPHGGGGSSSDSTVTCQGSLPANANLIQIDNTSNSNNIFQAFLGSDHHQQQNQPQPHYNQFGGNFGQLGSNSDQMAAAASPSTWLRPVPQTFLRNSPPPPPKPHSPLRFNNNAPFWNPSAAAVAANVSSHDHVPSNFYATLQTQQQIHQTPNFDEKPKSISEIRDSRSTAKRSGSDQPVAKRTKSETQSPSPAFKVRKEKMGDRIAALQQLVSPFGKTDAASVLSEAIDYIKFLHEQVTALSNPYMKSGASLQHHQQDQSNDPEAPRQDLRSRGLCLVPVSSTFPVTHETTVDFWPPTFGGTFR